MCKARHKLCGVCHEGWKSEKGQDASCPECRGPMIEDDVDKIMHREVCNYVTEPQAGNQCEYPWVTCRFTGTFADILAHAFDHLMHTCSDGLIELLYENSEKKEEIMIRGKECTVRTQLPAAANANARTWSN